MHLPEDGRPVLHDFLYVDFPRVRSLLGQLYQGLPEKIEEISERLGRWSVGGSTGLIRGEVGRQMTSRSQETRSLAELHFAMLEEAAEATGFLHDISDLAVEVNNWENGVVWNAAPEGSIVRIEAPSNITDGHYFSEMVGHMIESGALGDNEAKANMVRAMTRVMYPKGVVIRIMPCGPDRPNHGFVGTLLEKSEYIEPERSALYGRYGNEARHWTTVGIVARRGASPNDIESPEFHSVTSSRGAFERDKLDLMIQKFSTMMEYQGANESPIYPGSAIIPLAVYRPIIGPPRVN